MNIKLDLMRRNSLGVVDLRNLDLDLAKSVARILSPANAFQRCFFLYVVVGVVETGLFIEMVECAIFGKEDGSVNRR